MAPRHAGMRAKHAVLDGRRCRRSVVPDVCEGRLPLEVRGEHVLLQTLAVRRCAVLVLVLVVIRPAIEVSWPFVLVRAAML